MLRDPRREPGAHRRIVDDAGFGNVERAEADGRGLELAQSLRTDRLAGDAVRTSPLLELDEPRELRFVHGDDDLAADRKRHAFAGAEFLHHPLAPPASGRLQRPGPVVEAGVEHAGVPSRLVAGDAAFLLEDDDARVGEAL